MPEALRLFLGLLPRPQIDLEPDPLPLDRCASLTRKHPSEMVGKVAHLLMAQLLEPIRVEPDAKDARSVRLQ